MRSFLLSVSLTITAAVLFAGCSERLPNTPSQPAPSEFAGIQVIGPDSVPVGQCAQFFAMLRKADGTTKSVTSMPNLRWRSSDPTVLLVFSSGLACPPDPSFDDPPAAGETMITAEITPSGVQGSRQVVVR